MGAGPSSNVSLATLARSCQGLNQHRNSTAPPCKPSTPVAQAAQPRLKSAILGSGQGPLPSLWLPCSCRAPAALSPPGAAARWAAINVQGPDLAGLVGLECA